MLSNRVHFSARTALAPLDHQLLTRLTNLTRTVDELTESAVLSRRELPTRRAEALRAREEVVDSLREREDEGRQRQRKAGFGREQDEEEDKGMVVDLERREEVGKTLQRSLEQADLLADVSGARWIGGERERGAKNADQQQQQQRRPHPSLPAVHRASPRKWPLYASNTISSSS